MSARATPAAQPSATPVQQLRRVRWAVRATLTLGVATSVAANILHARPNPISQVIAAWPPLALLLTVELISRVPVHRRSLGIVRLAATAAIAGIAAWVSYWHMAGVAARYGELGASPYLLPLSVDGLVIVASVSLVELAGRITATAPDNTTPASIVSSAGTTSTGPARQSHTAPLLERPAPAPAARQAAPDVLARPTLTGAAPATRTDTDTESVPHAAHPNGGVAEDSTCDEGDDSEKHETTRVEPDLAGAQRQPEGSNGDQTTSPSAWQGGDTRAHNREQQDADSSIEETSMPSDTAAAVAYWHRRDPNLHPAQIGAKIGRSERTVRRYWPPAPQMPPATVNGKAASRLAGTVRSR